MNAYHAFLANKAPVAHASGFSPSTLPDCFFDFQKHCVDFAIRQGRTGLYLDTGLGKTRCQLEWAMQSAMRNQRLMSPGQVDMCMNSPFLAWIVPSKRGNIDRRLRQAVIERDGQYCSYCAEFVQRGKIAIDHVQSVLHGGTDDADNMVVSCKGCNSRKGSKSLLQWLWEMAA